LLSLGVVTEDGIGAPTVFPSAPPV
jgi:hypothetical protein